MSRNQNSIPKYRKSVHVFNQTLWKIKSKIPKCKEGQIPLLPQIIEWGPK